MWCWRTAQTWWEQHTFPHPLPSTQPKALLSCWFAIKNKPERFMFAHIRGKRLDIFHQNLIYTRFSSKFYWTAATAMNLRVTAHASWSRRLINQMPWRKAASQSLPRSQFPILSPEERMATEAAWVSMLETWESCPLWHNRISILWVLNSRKPQIRKKSMHGKTNRKQNQEDYYHQGSTLNPCEKTGATPEVDSRTHPQLRTELHSRTMCWPRARSRTSNLEHNLEP